MVIISGLLFFKIVLSIVRKNIDKKKESKSTASTPEQDVKQTRNDTERRYNISALYF